MAEVMQLIETERKRLGISAEKFANAAGVTSTTYSRQKNGRQALGIDAVRAYARYARETGNQTILKALAAFALCLDPDDITIAE